MKIERENVLFCRKAIEQYSARTRELKQLAETCPPRSKGAYMSHAKQCQDNVERWQKIEKSQMEWLKKNNYDLYRNLVNA